MGRRRVGDRSRKDAGSHSPKIIQINNWGPVAHLRGQDHLAFPGNITVELSLEEGFDRYKRGLWFHPGWGEGQIPWLPRGK